MNEEYFPESSEKLLLDTDRNEIRKKMELSLFPQSTKTKTMDFVLNNLGIDNQKVNNALLLRNYIYISVIVRKHLQEINNRQLFIKKQAKKIEDTSSYAYKKLQYFLDRNQAAKEEITDFICYSFRRYIVETSSKHIDLIDRDKEKDMWLQGPTYNYQYSAEFYDPECDFSTYVKFYNIPGVRLIDSLPNIESHIALKKASPKDYFDEIFKIVNENDMVAQMSSRVSSNYHIHERKEIFESMATLFKEEKFLSFISLAAIQLEGIFYELTNIKFGKKERQGTLVSKVEKAFKSNLTQMQTLYPYFAFDIPDLRNQVAHKGIVEGRDLKQTAYELVLDLNCVLYLTEKASTDKFVGFIIISKKLSEIKEKNCKSKEEYRLAIARCLFDELYMSDMMKYEYFWELLVKPGDYDEEMEYYHPGDLKKGEISIKGIVIAISNCVKSDVFWAVTFDICNNFNVRLSDEKLLYFIEKLKSKFIAILDGNAKKDCCKINSIITRAKKTLYSELCYLLLCHKNTI